MDTTQKPLNKAKHAPGPSAAETLGKNLVSRKVSIQQVEAVRAEALALMGGAYISAITAHGRGPRPEGKRKKKVF